MFRQYRKFNEGEFIIVSADCSQGGKDENFAHFISKTNFDIPMAYQQNGVASEMTDELYPVLKRIFDTTGVKPVVCFERNNGGGSEMHRLNTLNREGKYELYVMQTEGTTEGEIETKLFGFNTTMSSRPVIISELKKFIQDKVLKIYDAETINQLKTFIVNRTGKPIAAQGKRDDAVISLAIGVWLLSRVEESKSFYSKEETRRILEEEEIRFQREGLG